MAATRGDGSTDVPVSVAELCRRLGSAPATTDSLSTGATPVLVGDLLRREGRPPVRAEVPAARVAPSPSRSRTRTSPSCRRRGAAVTPAGRHSVRVASSSPGPCSAPRSWRLPVSAVPCRSARAGTTGPGSSRVRARWSSRAPHTARCADATSWPVPGCSGPSPTTRRSGRRPTRPGPGARAAGVVPVAGPAGPVQALAPAGAAATGRPDGRHRHSRGGRGDARDGPRDRGDRPGPATE